MKPLAALTALLTNDELQLFLQRLLVLAPGDLAHMPHLRKWQGQRWGWVGWLGLGADGDRSKAARKCGALPAGGTNAMGMATHPTVCGPEEAAKGHCERLTS